MPVTGCSRERGYTADRICRLRLKCDGTRAEARFGLSAKRTSPSNSAGASVQSTAGSRVVRISGSNAGYTTFRGGVRVLATHSIRQFPLHFPSRASLCAIRFQLGSKSGRTLRRRQRSPCKGRAAQVSVFHTFQYVSASCEVEQGSTVLRLLLPAPHSNPDTVLQRITRRAEQRRFL